MLIRNKSFLVGIFHILIKRQITILIHLINLLILFVMIIQQIVDNPSTCKVL